MPEGATGRPLIRLSSSLPPADPLRDTLGTSAEGAATNGLVSKIILGWDKKDANTEWTKDFKPSSLAREGRAETGEVTWLALLVTFTEGGAEVGVATN